MRYLASFSSFVARRSRNWKRERKEKLSSGRRCRTAASHGAVLVDGVAGRVRRVRGLPGAGASEPADKAYAHQFQASSIANHEELLRD